jgi:hypothetical protein
VKPNPISSPSRVTLGAPGVTAAALLRRMSKYWSDGPAATEIQSLILMPTTGFTLREKILDERE